MDVFKDSVQLLIKYHNSVNKVCIKQFCYYYYSYILRNEIFKKYKTILIQILFYDRIRCIESF